MKSFLMRRKSSVRQSAQNNKGKTTEKQKHNLKMRLVKAQGQYGRVFIHLLKLYATLSFIKKETHLVNKLLNGVGINMNH
jgi:hypothetical protein